MPSPQPSVKEQMVQIIEAQPEDSSFDEILRELAFARMIERGLEDVDQSRTVSHEEMGRKIESWGREGGSTHA
jgi:predicted transcriptional regulator